MIRTRSVAGTRARQPLTARMRGISRRLGVDRRARELAAIIRKHPRATAGVAVAAGLVLRLARTGARRTLPGKIGMLVGGIAFRAAGAALADWMSGLVSDAVERHAAPQR